MNLRQVKGNTWVLEGLEFIPLYRLDGGRCVLLDTGLAQEREELEQALARFFDRHIDVIITLIGHGKHRLAYHRQRKHP